jgi:cytochrome c5
MKPRYLTAAVLLVSGFAIMALTHPDMQAPPAATLPEAQTGEAAVRPKPSVPAAGSRGQLLYENHCLGCHESIVHIRGSQTMRSLPDLRAKVAQWAVFLRLTWGRDEIEDVTRFLDNNYYFFEARP